MAGVVPDTDSIGRRIEELDTPALCLDRRLFVGNLERMAAFFRDRPAKLRPHFKNNKCGRIAQAQLAAGAIVGMTCAKLGEAEVLADAGCRDILIANQVVGQAKVARLVALADRLDRIRVAVDAIDQACAIAEAARTAGVEVGLLVEVDIGMNRCGVQPGDAALDLARQILDLDGVTFDGLQAYEGHLVAVADRDERRQRVCQDMAAAVATRRLIEAAGIPVRIVSGGSTSTYDVTGTIEGIDEIQAGTYPTMDAMYEKLTPEFDVALSVAARVISRPKKDIAVLDVGAKGLGHEFGPPRAKDPEGASVAFALSEEHCTGRGAYVGDWKVGQIVELIPSHACTTCNLYRWMYVHENGTVLDVWPIEASGKMT